MDSLKRTVIIHINRNIFSRLLKWFFICLALGLVITPFVVMKQRCLSEELASYLRSTLDNLVEKSLEILFEFVRFVSMIFTVPVFAFFLLKDGQRLKRSRVTATPLFFLT